MKKTKIEPAIRRVGMTYIATIPANALDEWWPVASPNPPPVLKDEYVRQLLAEIGKQKPMLREIKIEPVLNGWIVLCGCQRLVFTDKKHLLSELGKYYADPVGTQRRYLEKRVNKTEHLPGHPGLPPCEMPIVTAGDAQPARR